MSGGFPSYAKPVAAAVARPSRYPAQREQLDCRFAAVDDVFDDCMDLASRRLSVLGLQAYVTQARRLGKLGRGVEPMLVFLEIWPDVAQTVGEAAIGPLDRTIDALQKSPNGPAIVLLLQSLKAVARRLASRELLTRYLDLVVELMQRTSVSIHGRHATIASPGLPEFLRQAPGLVALVPIEGLCVWVEEGIRLHGNHPERQKAFFSLATADSRALLQRQRRGTLLVDVERNLDLGMRLLWGEAIALVPIPCTPGSSDEALPVMPYALEEGWRLPEVLESIPPADGAGSGVSGLTGYRCMIAHLAAHRRWSDALVADNLSPMQRFAVEVFEDCRVDLLAMEHYPGLRRWMLAMHPAPKFDACDPAVESGLRHRLTCLSRAMLDPGHEYADPVLLEFRAGLLDLIHAGGSTTQAVARLALQWTARTRRQHDQQARLRFTDTVVAYRDDNRHLWTYIEAGDEEESFQRRQSAVAEPDSLPPRLYPEWDAAAGQFLPDWVSVYDTLQAGGDAASIDALLARHAQTARQLKRLLDILKPQDRTRLRKQEEGSELDLDVALRVLTDLRAGAVPDMRVNMSTRTDGRDIAVLLLLDLSESVNDPVDAAGQTVLDISRSAVALLAWAIDTLGDELAIAGFHSNTRHEVRYLHIQGFAEGWGDAAKSRLAGARGALSTRMGAALRHGGHYLSGRSASRRLLLVLTDGQPADLDVPDPEHLREDAAHAVQELRSAGVYTHCISLDAKADSYVGRIFGSRWSIIDRVAELPRRLPEIFLALTR